MAEKYCLLIASSWIYEVIDEEESMESSPEVVCRTNRLEHLTVEQKIVAN